MMRFRFALAAAFGFALCAIAPARAVDTIVTGMLGSPSSGGWPYYIALKKGMFEAAGIKLDIIYVPTAPGLVQQLSAGSLDIVGTIGVVEPIHAVEKGAPVALIRLVGAISPYAMLAKPEIQKVEDLKGKTVCIGGLVDINRIYLERIMQAHGLHHGDYDIVVAGSTGARFAALKSGTVDATMLVPPQSFVAEKEGFRNIGMILDYAKDLPFSGADVRLDWAAKHGDTLKRFLGVLDQSVAWFYADGNREEAIDILAEASHANRDQVAQSYDFQKKLGYFARTNEISRTGLAHLIQAMKDLGDIEGKVTPEKLVIKDVTPLVE
jgi:NitT/TauT family transport system substrate-binding protein